MKLCLLLFFLLVASTEAKFEPYNVLEVHRKANIPEIRKAYKTMAKTWHPDKNSDPSAEKRFVEINKAYELLSDPERRRQYDNYGITEDSPNFRKKHDYSAYERFEPFDSFNYFFDNGGRAFRFGFGSGEGSHQSFHKVSITSKAYYSTVLPSSEKQPYLILFYSDWCFTCSRIEPMWRRLIEELEPVGFGVSAVHTEHEKDLTRKLGVKELPHLIMLLEGKVIHYRSPQFSAVKTIEFIRRKFPYKMVERIDDYNVDVFLNGWKDNRVRVLLFGKVDTIRLRYLTTAFKYRNRALLGYVKMGDPSTAEVVKRFGISSAADALLLFRENTETPTASFTMKDLPLNTIQEIIEAHQFLQLPRLSSQGIYDQLCPPSVSRQRLFCVILFTRDSSEYELHQRSMREFAGAFKSDRVRFAYVFMERQTEFVKALEHASQSTEGQVLASPHLEDNVVIITWRKDHSKVKYEHLNKRWRGYSEEEIDPSSEELKSRLKRLLLASPDDDGISLPYDAEIRELMDEHAVSLFVRIANRMIETLETIRENITKDELLPAVSIVVTIGFLVIASYVISYLVKMEEESVQRQLGAKGLKVDKKGKVVPELKIHELRAETYNGMVRLLKPGCRTIVLIVDRESKEKLVPKFYKMAWPYRRNKTLMFGFLYIEKGLPWFKKILNLTLPDPRDININPKNCIGTVMSLNGHRRYFCMYHAKHPEGSRRKVYQANNGSAGGAFMGFDSDLDDSSENETDLESGNPKKGPSHLLDSPDHLPIFEDQLLDGLQMWLDRLFEGSTYRYHINYWPEFPISPASFTTR